MNGAKWLWLVALAGCSMPATKDYPTTTDTGAAPDVGAEICMPRCDGRRCGDDGCGGGCGVCTKGFKCGSAFQCEVDPLGVWVIQAVGANVLPKGGWNVDGSAPDPYVCVTIGGAQTCSPYVADSYTPKWDFSFPPASISSLRPTITVAMYDDDVGADDAICTPGPIEMKLDYFVAGGFSITCGETTATFNLRPK